MALNHYLKQCWIIICEVQWHLRAISQEMNKPSVTEISLKITHLKFHINLSGNNEWKIWFQDSSPRNFCQFDLPRWWMKHSRDQYFLGQNILLWTREEEVIEKQQQLLDQFKQQRQHSNSSQDGQQRNPGSRDGSSSRGRNKSTKDAKGKTKGKVQTKVSVKTKEKKR